MTEGPTQRQDPGRDPGTPQADAGSRTGGRKLAEWVTMGVSTALVLGVVGFLIYQMTREQGPFVAVEVRLLADQTRQSGGRYVTPVEIHNRGRRTLRSFRGEVTFQTPDGTPGKREFEIDYLGEQVRRTVYVYFDRRPNELKDLYAVPLDYQLD